VLPVHSCAALPEFIFITFSGDFNMAIKIKGFHDESQVIVDANTTVIVDKKAFIHYGGDIDLSALLGGGVVVGAEPAEEPEAFSLAFGYGIIEDMVANPDISGNTYKIDGKVTGLLGAVATFGDDTTIKIGKTADLNGGLGIGISSLSDVAGLGGLTFGSVFTNGANSKITIAKGGEVNGLFGVTVGGLGSSAVNSGDIDAGIVGMMSGSFNLGGLAPAPVFAAALAAPASTTKLTNNGNIDSLVGIAGFATDNQVLTNGKKGEIDSLIGIIGGVIPTGEEPVEIGTLKIQNSGDIVAAVGMLGFVTPDMTLINAKSGEIISGIIGMGVMSMDGFDSTITNAGTIRVTLSLTLPEEMEGLLPISSAAIFGYMGNETVTNTGKLYGDVLLGGGQDTFTMAGGLLDGDVLLGDGHDTIDYAGGKITGKIYGGAGDDTLIVTKANAALVELVDGGDDTVRSAISYTLADNVENLVLTGKNDVNATGNAGDNVLTGNQGKNTLAGGVSTDVLTGGLGADIFVFATGDGTDTITDFTTEQNDRIDISGWTGITDFASIQANATAVDGDVVITVGGDVLVIADRLLADLGATDFIFA